MHGLREQRQLGAKLPATDRKCLKQTGLSDPRKGFGQRQKSVEYLTGKSGLAIILSEYLR